MKLLSYFESMPRGERARVARAAGVDYTTIWRIATERMPASSDLAARISKATGGKVSVAELLFPDGVPDGVSMSSDEAAAAAQDPTHTEAADAA